VKRYINLMSSGARFRTAARVRLRRWALALAVMVTVLAPLSIIRWDESRKTRNEHEAMEAGYEPIRRLIQLNRDLRTQAAALVGNERLALELSRRHPATTLLGLVGAAAAESRGELFIEHLTLTQLPPGVGAAPTPTGAREQMVIEAAATLTYDIAGFVESLQKAPIASVKVVSDVVVSQDGMDRKNYTIECTL
jgi:hypothetical protein